MDIQTLDSGPPMLKLGALAVDEVRIRGVSILDTDSAGAKLTDAFTEVVGAGAGVSGD